MSPAPPGAPAQPAQPVHPADPLGGPQATLPGDPPGRGDPKLGALCMLVLVGLYAYIGRDPVAAAILGPVVALSGVLRWRVKLSALAQVGLSFALLTLALLLWQVLPGPGVPFRGSMGPLVPFLSMGSILLASHRLFLENPAGGDRVTVAHGFWCLVACGSQKVWAPYVGGCALYLLLSAAWLRRSGRPWVLGNHRGWWVAAMALSAALSGALARAIPPLHGAVVEWLIGDESRARIGLSDGPLELGSLSNPEGPDQVVARAYGLREGLLLRAFVYQDYSRGRWIQRPSSLARSTPIRGEGGPVELRYEATDVPRFLLPLAARRVALSSDNALVDAFGAVAPLLGSQPRWARYQEAPRDLFQPSAPDPFDLQIPSSIRAAVGEVARRMTGAAATPEARLQKIERALMSEHPYSLRFTRKPGLDPAVAFMTEPGAEGHCEYFATAAALLARASGVPARLVGGYRVSEYNEAGGYHVVRERHAHAWVEAYVEGKGWVTVDATPPDSRALAGPATTPALAAWLDLLRLRGADLLQRALERPAPVAAALLAVVVFIVGRDLLRSRKARGRAAAGALDAAPPPPHLSALLDSLARRGLARAPSEPLEALARRVEAALPGDEAPALLRLHAALRYGGVGSEGEIRQAIERYTARPPGPRPTR